MDTKILIGVPTAEYARRADFYDYFNSLTKPAGTAITFSHGQSPARNRNLIIRQALDIGCTHLFFLDDDVAFRPDLMMNLLKHDKDVVTGLYLMRSYPHQPIVFDFADSDGKVGWHYLEDNEHGLIRIRSCGLGCVLIKTSVFKKLEELGLSADSHGAKDKWVTLGQLESDHWCDDTSLFNKIHEAGIEMYCDLDQHVGHMASITVWPEIINGKWYSTYESNSRLGRASIPAAKISEIERLSREHYKKELSTV